MQERLHHSSIPLDRELSVSELKITSLAEAVLWAKYAKRVECELSNYGGSICRTSKERRLRWEYSPY